MQKLGLDTLHIKTYSDASFSTIRGYNWQLGYIAMLFDKEGNACILLYASYKSKRVARSVLGAETYAVANAYEYADCAKK